MNPISASVKSTRFFILHWDSAVIACGEKCTNISEIMTGVNVFLFLVQL